MTWTAKINEWAEWASARLKGRETIPSPRYWGSDDVPWWDDFLNLLGEEGAPRELRAAFEAAIRNDGLAARFVGLELYHRLAHQDSYPLSDDLVEDARRM